MSPTSTETTTTVCSKCNGTGWVFVNDNTVRECDCGLLERQRQESKLRFAAIPETYKNVTLRDIKTSCYTKPESKSLIKATAELVKWYLDNLDENVTAGKGIYLWSDTKGSGKTMMATAIANELINKYRRYVKFATSLDILDEIKATFGNKEDNESRLLYDLSTSEFLIIDDFGTERVTDWVGEKFYQIVNGRYINKKVTIFTSNHDLKTLNYDDRITSRIRERSYLVHFPEESVREFKAVEEEMRRGHDKGEDKH